jgi:MFS family permease
MGARLVGLVGALPVVAHVLQLGGAFLTARFGHRRTALVTVALSRQMFLPLALLPWLPLGPEGRKVLLLVAAGAHHGLGILANNAWNAWMGEMIPRPVRGRYYGSRTAICTLVGGAFALAAGLSLDRAQRSASAGSVLQGLAVVASVAGALSVFLVSRQHAEPARREPLGWALRALMSPLRDPQARRVTVYAMAWNGACGLSAPFFGLYLLRDLSAGYALFAAQGAGLALARMASASAWGRAVDRFGSKRVLVVCTSGLALSPLAWLACGPDRLWPLAVETAAGGLLLGGHAVASFDLPLSVAPDRERPFYIAVTAAAGGAAFAVTSALGGAFAEAVAVQGPLRFLLAGSAALRLVAIGAALALPLIRRTPSRATVAPRPPALDVPGAPALDAPDLDVPLERRAA